MRYYLLEETMRPCEAAVTAEAATALSQGMRQRRFLIYACRSITAISGRLKMRGTRSCPESPEVMIMRMPSLS